VVIVSVENSPKAIAASSYVYGST